MSDPKKETVEHFLDHLGKERGYSRHTVRVYRIDLTQFCNFLNNYFGEGVPDFVQVDKTAVKHFLNYLLERGLSPRSVSRKLATLKSFFKYLVRAEELSANPVSSMKVPKVSKRLPVFLEENVVARLMEMPTNNPLRNSKPWECLRDKAILEFFYSTGIRLSELVSLSVGDVSLDENLAKIHGKGNKERIAPFGDTAKESLVAYLEEMRTEFGSRTGDKPLFLSRTGKRMSPRTIEDRLQRYFERMSAGTRFGPHLLRHTFATHLLDRGLDIQAVKELLGHASLSSTQVYTHLKVEQMKKAFKQAHPHA